MQFSNSFCKVLFLGIALILIGCANDEEFDGLEVSEEEQTAEPSGLNELSSTYGIDKQLNILLINRATTELDPLMLLGNDTVAIDKIDSGLETGTSLRVSFRGEDYDLHVTDLPIINIDSGDNEIVDEPKKLGTLELMESDGETFISNIGIELRGLASQKFPKKSYNIELWKDEIGNDKDSEALLAMRKDDDWILDGLWNEPLRLRDYAAWELWLRFGRYPYQEKEDITLGIKRKYVELFLNESYRGLYYLGEKVDRKQLQLKKFDSVLRGELYKGVAWEGGTLYSELDTYPENTTFWSGYESEYPDINTEADFRNLYDLTDLTLNGSDEVFKESVFEMVSLENMVDYFIFLNLVHAPDNIGRNLYTSRYDTGDPYFFVPWDMDGTFGNTSKGERLDFTERILQNGLMERLLISPEFVLELKERWNFLKVNTLSTSFISSEFEALFLRLRATGVYDRENLSADLPFEIQNEDELEFINSFIEKQWLFLDGFVTDL